MTPACPACGWPGADDGPTHAYLSSSAACWRAYGDIMAREFSDLAYWPSHRLLVDAYAGQHSTLDDRRARQSLYLHISALILHFEDGMPGDNLVAFLKRAAHQDPYPLRPMPAASLTVCIAAVHAADTPQAHATAVDAYARGVYTAWSPHHATFRDFIQRINR